MKAILHPIAGKYLQRLNEQDRIRIKKAIEGLEENPPEGDIMSVAGQKGIFRLRIGGHRLLFRVKENSIFVTHIEPRGQVYNKKNKGGKR
jgi:mRNA interferase RelE/StbE